MTKKTRRKIDAALKGEDRIGGVAGVLHLAQRYQVHPNQIYASGSNGAGL